jgi:pilus assembly protein CpaF
LENGEILQRKRRHSRNLPQRRGSRRCQRLRIRLQPVPRPKAFPKTTIFNALIDAIDLTQLAKLDADSAREEIRDIVNEIISFKNVAMSIAEQEELLEDICNDVLGYGPLEPLLAATTSPTSWSTAPACASSKSTARCRNGVRFRDNASC